MRQILYCLTLFTILFMPCSYWLAFAENIEISSFYGKYNIEMKKAGQQSLSLRGPKIEKWTTPTLAEKTFNIGVCLPHLKDSYWLSVCYGIINEAQKSGVKLSIVEAGGYRELSTQQKQLKEFEKKGVDGIILGSISYKGNNSIVAELESQGIPVVAIMNDIEAPSIKAKSMVSFYEMGFYAGEFVAEHANNIGKKSASVIIFPGPRESGWADETLEGFIAATEFSETSIVIEDIRWGETGKSTQKKLIDNTLTLHPDTDYIVGNAVAADTATELLSKNQNNINVISTYITPQIYDKIKMGEIMASPADMSASQGRIAVDMLVRILNGQKPGFDFPFRAGPLIPVISSANIGSYPFERLFGPRDFKPVFKTTP